MTMLQVFVQAVLVVLGLCKQHTILNRMVKAGQHTLGGFLCVKKLRIGFDIIKLIHKIIVGYRTKRVGFIGDGASKLLAPSPF